MRESKGLVKRSIAFVIAVLMLCTLANIPVATVQAADEETKEFSSFGTVEYDDDTGTTRKILERRTVVATETSLDMRVEASEEGVTFKDDKINYKWEDADKADKKDGQTTGGNTSLKITEDKDDTSKAKIEFDENLTLSDITYSIKVTAEGETEDGDKYKSEGYIEIVQKAAVVKTVEITKPEDTKSTMLNRNSTIAFESRVTNADGRELTGEKESYYWVVDDTTHFVITAEDGGKATLSLTEAGKTAGELYATVRLSVGGVRSDEKQIIYLGKDVSADGVEVTFVANDPLGNTDTKPSFRTKTVVQGEPFGELPTISKSGYTFLGWYNGSDENGKGGKKIESTTLVPIGTDKTAITLYAHWIVGGASTSSGGSVASTDANAMLTVTSGSTGSATAIFAGVKDDSATRLVIPETAAVSGTTYRITGIGKKALAKNSSIRMLSIEAKVQTIDKKAFKKMKKVSTIELYPDNLTSIGKKAFAGLKDGTEVVIYTNDQQRYERVVNMIRNAGGTNLSFTRKAG